MDWRQKVAWYEWIYLTLKYKQANACINCWKVNPMGEISDWTLMKISFQFSQYFNMQDHSMQINWSLTASGWWVTSVSVSATPIYKLSVAFVKSNFSSCFPYKPESYKNIFVCKIISDRNLLFKVFSWYSSIVPWNSSSWCIELYVFKFMIEL